MTFMPNRTHIQIWRSNEDGSFRVVIRLCRRHRDRVGAALATILLCKECKEEPLENPYVPKGFYGCGGELGRPRD